MFAACPAQARGVVHGRGKEHWLERNPPSAGPAAAAGRRPGAGSTTGGPLSRNRGSRAGGPKLQAALKACGVKLLIWCSCRARAPLAPGDREVRRAGASVSIGRELWNPNLSGGGSAIPLSIRSNAKFEAVRRCCQMISVRQPWGKAGLEAGGTESRTNAQNTARLGRSRARVQIAISPPGRSPSTTSDCPRLPERLSSAAGDAQTSL